MTRRQGLAEAKAGSIGGNGLAQGAKEHDAQHHPENMTALEEQSHIDQHAHSYQEVGNEEGVAYKLEPVHQW